MVIPEELVREILVRLPAKSLIRFKSVERSWNDLFRTPSFIKSHHSQMQILHRNENLVMISHTDNEDNCCFILISDSSQSETQFDINYIFPEFETRSSLHEYLLDVVLYGHCNGVFCLYLSLRDRDEIPNKLILWNPATREVKVVPLPPHLLSHFAICGFGVDPNNSNDLNLVYLSFDSHPLIAEIYNLSTDSWTLIPIDNDIVEYSHQLTPDHKSYLVNGVCYWLIVLRGKDFLSFDFRDKQFRKIKTPPTKSLCEFYDLVTEVNGSLAYVVNCSLSYEYDTTHNYELWIMEQDRWTKIYNIGPFDDVHIWAIWKNGTEFLGGSPDGSLVSYNSYGQPVRRFQVPCHHRIHAAGYVESIAPLSF